MLGDSILDNAPYTSPEPDTAEHLKRELGPSWEVELLARDGDRMQDVEHQLSDFEGRPDAAFLSIGGNDLTPHMGLLDRPSARTSEVLQDILAISESFAASYERVARAVSERVEHTFLCTIYEVELEPRSHAELARVPLAVFNDRIIRIASKLGLHVLELRSVCTEPEDYILQIEPSARGARKNRRRNFRRAAGIHRSTRAGPQWNPRPLSRAQACNHHHHELRVRRQIRGCRLPPRTGRKGWEAWAPAVNRRRRKRAKMG